MMMAPAATALPAAAGKASLVVAKDAVASAMAVRATVSALLYFLSIESPFVVESIAALRWSGD